MSAPHNTLTTGTFACNQIPYELIEYMREQAVAVPYDKVQEKQQIPFWLKQNLTLEEAAAYFGIGINKIREITNDERCKCVLFVGTKRLIKRAKFEQFLAESYSI